MNNPIIMIPFKGLRELNQDIRDVYVQSLNDAINLARGDKAALGELRLMVENAYAHIKKYEYEIKREEDNQAAEAQKAA